MDCGPDLFDVEADPRWLLVVEGWVAGRELAIEGRLPSSTAISALGPRWRRGAAQAAATPDRQVIAAPTDELVVAPDWSKLRVVVDGTALTMDTAEVLAHRRTLDLRRGVLLGEWRLRVGDRTTRLRSLRFASLDDRHVLGQALEVMAEDWFGEVMVEAIVDGDVINEGGVRHLVGHRARRVKDGMLLETSTAQRHIDICLATSTTLAGDDGRGVVSEEEPGERALVWRCRFDASPGRAWRLGKLVTVWTGRDDPTRPPVRSSGWPRRPGPVCPPCWGEARPPGPSVGRPPISR